MIDLAQYLTVGMIQPVIDPDRSWGSPDEKDPDGYYNLNIDAITAERVWDEIRAGLAGMMKGPVSPDIILIPELHVPVSKITELRSISRSKGIMIIAGVDFQRNPVDPLKIRNRGLITIPNSFGTSDLATRQHTMYFGKTYFTYMERQMFAKGIFKKTSKEVCYEDPEQRIFIFKSQRFGNFGIMICSDIFDIERMMLYQGQIHHLFIISLNKDLNTYFAMAESLTRMLYCNVVVCNSGFYGGSMAISPFEKDYDRIIYKHQGQRMFNTQTVTLPVAELDRAQIFDFVTENKKVANILFKASPPGYPRMPTAVKKSKIK